MWSEYVTVRRSDLAGLLDRYESLADQLWQDDNEPVDGALLAETDQRARTMREWMAKPPLDSAWGAVQAACAAQAGTEAYLIEASDWADRYVAEGAVREADREAVTAALVEAAPGTLEILSEITFAAGRHSLLKAGLWRG